MPHGHFFKIEGCGNSFIVVDASNYPAAFDFTTFAKKVCSVGFGVGSDGLMVVGRPTVGADQQYSSRVMMFNPDGSDMGMCGNGVRCVTRYLFLAEHLPSGEKSVGLLVGTRRIVCYSTDDGQNVTVNMGEPILNPQDIPVNAGAGCCEALNFSHVVNGREFKLSCVSMGNPHAVVFEAVDNVPLWGSLLEVDPIFPKRTNVEFVSVLSPNHINVAVWERGVGITLACGTGACASVVAATRLGLVDGGAGVTVQLPGGSVLVTWNGGDVTLTGPATEVCRGELCSRFYE